MGNMCNSSKNDKNDSQVVSSFTATRLNNLTVEFPKEIEEDLERRKIESFKALAAGVKKPSRTTSGTPDAAEDIYEKMKNLDLPAVMVPKPWSEVDQILSKLKPNVNDTLASQKGSPLPRLTKPQQTESIERTETIDMSELMDDLQSEEEVSNSDSRESLGCTPKQIRTLESSLSFTTIHTVKEVEGGAVKPETVTSILKARNHQSPKGPTPTRTTSAMANTPRKVNVNINPRLLSRIEAFS